MRRGSGWMGQKMINVEKTNIEGESKTDRESVQEKERKWLDGTEDDKCRENKH